jgi:hypothetical protein
MPLVRLSAAFHRLLLWIPTPTVSASLRPARILLFAISCALACLNVPLTAQSTDTGSVTGSVRDQTEAVVPGATVELTNPSTGIHLNTTSDPAGIYRFAQVQPGDYQIKVSASGFKPALLNIKVNVAQSALGNVTLSLGQSTQVVEVQSVAATAELQTTNSAVGDVLQHQEIDALPTSQREITEIVYLQPATTPISGGPEGQVGGGSVAGGRVDQNVLTLDGINITDQAEGGYLVSGTIASFGIPEDAIQEFRGIVSNPSEEQARSGGGQFAMTTRRGGNAWHATAYDYYKNRDLNANTWINNRLGQPRPGLISNRYGGSVSGPIIKNRTFFFLDYEGYNFPQSQNAVAMVPSQALKDGILQFRNTAGNIVSYNLNPASGPLSMACGPNGNLLCDPRGLGFNPIIQQYMNTFYPAANDPSTGDGLNTLGLRASVATPIKTQFGLFRIDHNLNSKWRLFGEVLDEQIHIATTDQIDFNPAVAGSALLKSVSGTPQYPLVTVVGATGSLTPSLVYDFRFGYNEQGFKFAREFPQTLLPSLGESIQLAGTVLSQPGVSLRSGVGPEESQDKSWQWNNQFSWLKHGHVFSGGVIYQHINDYHYRTTSGGAQAIPVAQITGNINVVLPATVRPPTCVGVSNTACLPAGFQTQWNALYGALLGIWDDTQAYNARSIGGQVLPATARLAYDQTVEHFEFIASDAWQITPSLVLNYGFNMTYETPYYDQLGNDYLIINADTGKLIDPTQVLQQKEQAALAGQVYNVPMAYVHPAQLGGREIYNPVFNIGPRAGLAWNPSFKYGLLGKVFGDRRTVLRGGYALVHDQILAITTQLYGVIGNRLLATTATIQAPTCEFNGTPGHGCVSGSSPYRIGVDGPLSLPPPTPFSVPYQLAARNVVTGPSAFGAATTYGTDPNFHPGSIHSFNATIQRQLPGNTLLEFGWIGRYGRDLLTGENINAPPIVALKDLTGSSSQSLAQAFDGVANQLRAGVAPASVTSQPWFENVFGKGGTAAVATAGSSYLTSADANSFVQLVIDPMLQRAGRPTTENQQFGTLSYQVSRGWMNYNAGFVSLRKRASHGLTAIFNYTWAHCLDSGLAQADSLGGALDSPYDPSYNYGPCITDIRQSAQFFGRYDLPSPRNASRLIQNVLGGWATSYVFTASTGVPIKVTGATNAFGASSGGAGSVAPLAQVPSMSLHQNVIGTNGIATAGNAAIGGSGLNLFANPAQVFADLRPVELSTDTSTFRGLFNGLGAWNTDFSLSKETSITERMRVRLQVDFLNIFNHPNLLTPTVSLFSPTSFGVVTADNSANAGQNVGLGPRRLQASLRVDF